MTKQLPIRRGQLSVQSFIAWLASNGAEVGAPTNPYEVVRYRAYREKGRAETHIIYAKENGLLTFTGASRAHYERFLAGDPMVGKGEPFVSKFDYADPSDHPLEIAEGSTARRRKKLMERDGDGCWFCGKPLGSDVTLEHLVPRSRGGGNDAANCVLAHAECNQAAANLSISEKVELRSKMRAEEAA
jgi:hypothetical protein